MNKRLFIIVLCLWSLAYCAGAAEYASPFDPGAARSNNTYTKAEVDNEVSQVEAELRQGSLRLYMTTTTTATGTRDYSVTAPAVATISTALTITTSTPTSYGLPHISPVGALAVATLTAGEILYNRFFATDQAVTSAKTITYVPELYLVDADGTSNPVFVATGSTFTFNGTSIIPATGKFVLAADVATGGTTRRISVKHYLYRSGSLLGTNPVVYPWNGGQYTGGITFALPSAVVMMTSGTNSSINYMTPALTAGEPAWAAGRMYWDATNGCWSFYSDIASTSLQVGQEQWVRVKNETVSTITNGSVVYMTTPVLGADPIIQLAKADAAATSNAIGIVTADIASGDVGFVTVRGLVRDMNTAGVTAGDPIYLSAATAGAWTTTAPASPNFAVVLGYVLADDATAGIVDVDIRIAGALERAQFAGDIDVVGDVGAATLGVTGHSTITTASGTVAEFSGAGTAGIWINPATYFDVQSRSTDGADDKVLRLTGGGDISSNRGGYIALYANEAENYPGDTVINAGNVASGDITLWSAATERMAIKYSGNVLIATTTDDLTNKLQVNGGVSCTTVNGVAPLTAASQSQALVGLATVDHAAKNYTAAGWSTLGDAATGIKMKVLASSTASTEGGISYVLMDGVTYDKVIGWQTYVSTGSVRLVGPENTYGAGLQFHDRVRSSDIAVITHATNSENILSAPITILLWYKE